MSNTITKNIQILFEAINDQNWLEVEMLESEIYSLIEDEELQKIKDKVQQAKLEVWKKRRQNLAKLDFDNINNFQIN